MKYLNVFLIVYSLLVTNVFGATITDDTLKIGKPGSSANKEITLGTNKKIRANESTGKIEFSNDGSLYKNLGSGSGSGGSSGINILTNESFEDGIGSPWTSSGGTFTQQSYAIPSESDTKYGQFVATASGQYIEQIVSVPTNFSAGCQADFKKVNIATAGIFKVQALDVSNNILAEQTIGVSPWIKIPTISFQCPTTGSSNLKLRLTSLAAGTIQFDRAYIGSNQNIVESQCQGTVGCEDVFTATVASTGTVVRENLDWINGNCVISGTSISTCAYNTGIFTTAPSCTVTVNSNTGGTLIYSWMTDPSSTQVTTKTFLNGAISAEAYHIVCQKSGSDFTKAKPQTAVSSEQASWFIDANIGGANPNGTATTSYLPFENATLDLVLNTGSASAEIPCSGTNASTGLTCSSGSEQVGVAFNPPYAGVYEACIQGALYNNGPGTSTVQWVETANNSQTIITEGKARTAFNGVDNFSSTLNNCGTFTFNDVSKKTLRFSYESGATSLIIYGDRASSAGQRDMKITVRPLLSAFNRPILTGDQMTVPTSVKPVHYSGIVNGSGVISNKKGSFASSCTWGGLSGGVATCPLTNSHTTRLNCTCSVSDGVASAAVFWCMPLSTGTSSSQSFVTYANAVGPRDFTYQCDGELP
jgi:hypothetical protein